ncbi:MAG: outer membrane beta-barrel protein [Prevotella sp.]|nr:outer membrane beta-barrel protein [Prevotella sp.]
MKQEDWTQTLRQRLADHEEPAPADLWDDIEAQVSPASVVRRQPEHRRLADAKPRHAVLWRRWAAAAVLFAVAVGGGIVWWRKSEVPVANGGTTAEVVGKATIAAEQSVPKTEAPSVAAPLPCRGSTDEQPMREAADERLTEEAPSPTPTQQTPEPRTVEGGTNDMPASPTRPTEKLLAEQRPRPRHHRQQPTVSFYAGSSMASMASSNGVQMSQQMAQNYVQPYMSRVTQREPIYLVGYEEREKHHLPLSVGLTVTYPLSSRLSVGTGFVYTRLLADFTTLMNCYTTEKRQNLHYVGLPLSLHYQLLEWPGLSIYAAVNGQADWNIKAEVEADGHQRQTIGKDRVQWSAGVNVGAQYNFIPQVGVYVEPGLRHYFDNGSPVDNYFKEQPTSFSLQMGLRINIR